MNISKKSLFSFFIYFVSVGFTIILLFPLVNIIVISLQTTYDIAINVYPNYNFIPKSITLENYRIVIGTQNIGRPFLNSLIVSFSTASFVTALCIMGSYSFSRFKTKLTGVILLVFIFTRLIPPISMVIPFFILGRNIGLYDTRLLLIVIHTAFSLPYAIWILKGNIDQLPYQIEESAMIDGCSNWGTLIKIVVPLAKPGIVAIFIFSFLGVWNSFLIPLVLTARKAQTIQVALGKNIGNQEVFWNLLTASGVISLIPVISLALIFQKAIIKGIAEGSLKG